MTGFEWIGDELVPIDTARDNQGKFARDPDVADRDRDAMVMRAKGKSYRQIAELLGYGSASHAKTQIERYYKSVAQPDVIAYRAEMDARLDELYAAVMGVFQATHLKVVAGGVVFDPNTGGLLEDSAPKIQAANTLLRVMERQANLYGLDAPSKVMAQVQNVRVTVDGAEDV